MKTMKADTAFPGINTMAALALILAAIALLSSSCSTDYPVTLSVYREAPGTQTLSLPANTAIPAVANGHTRPTDYEVTVATDPTL